jgi:2-iminoacetate synthase
MRDGLLPLVVTRLSAGSCTSVGGYGEARRPDPQFEISDERNLDEVCAAARTQGLNPVLADWVPLREETAHA